MGRNVNNFQTHFFNSDNLLSHLNEIVILSKDEIIRKWLLSGSRLKGKSADCPQARAVEMGRGGLMVGDNETIKGENGQIVWGGGLSASEGGSGGREEGVRGFVRMSIVIFSSFLSYQS